MRIKSFHVQAFRNLIGSVTFGPLETVNVLYGMHEGGKSNLLRAMDCYFRLLGYDEAVLKTQPAPVESEDEAFNRLVREAFHRGRPEPIVFRVAWEITAQDLHDAGLLPPSPFEQVLTVLELRPTQRAAELRVEKFVLGSEDVAALTKESHGELVAFAQQIRRLLADCRPFQFPDPVHPFAFIGQPSSELFPQPLRDRLFDARQSLNPAERRRWSLFADLAGNLDDVLGPGRFETAFDRESGRAELIYEPNRGEPLTVACLGAGLQHMVRLLAELCLCQERWVALEEPERHLSPAFQQRFVRLAEQVVAAGVGPIQLFISSHAPELVAAGHPFLLTTKEGAPVVEQRPWAPAGGLAAPPNPPPPTPVAPARAAAPSAPGPPAAESPAAEPPVPTQPVPDVSELIEVVDSLAALEPEDLAAAAPDPATSAAGRKQEPSWKWKGKP